MASLVDKLAAAGAVSVDFRTAHTPPVVWAPDAGGGAGGDAGGASSSSGGGLRDAFLRWLRPELTVRTAFGTVHKAPFGAAGETSWPLVPAVVALVLLVVLALAGVGLVAVARRVVRG